MAERLSENPSLSVAVIEAGGFYEVDNGNTSVVPGYDAAYAFPTGQTLVDWGLVTEPQKVSIPITSYSLNQVNWVADTIIFLGLQWS